jgi:hypothetical protein
LPIYKRKYPIILEINKIKQKYIKVYFEKFYKEAEHSMYSLIEENNFLDDILCCQPLSNLILKKYHQIIKTKRLYTHFFKTNRDKNDDFIQNVLVGLNQRGGALWSTTRSATLASNRNHPVKGDLRRSLWR